MEYLNTMITDKLGPFGPLMLVGMLGVFLILLTLPVLMKKQADPLDRLKAPPRKETAKGEKLRSAQGNDKLDKYANFLEPQNREEYSAIK
ncbi:MAG: type II secretion system F family protein, partial [Yoonia sp.]|nr:type II secretion system F family protein [Yoonia sp.]